LYGVPLVALVPVDWLPGLELLVVLGAELAVMVTVVLEVVIEP